MDTNCAMMLFFNNIAAYGQSQARADTAPLCRKARIKYFIQIFCRDTFTSLKKTCRKLGISFWQYLLDRVTGGHQIPLLQDLIRQRAPCYQK